ncbi:hypothetical protein DFR41_106195 [Pseudacidovorax intermedius]|uniref:Uncharacterized protein n=1 Tax=Pseudacidovorax intermedius TaxID=433924 RepID=A0A370FGG9_9BURK|nr:hypothetical protein [Pseudacidovorax intermedius]RDI23489.1 hypothetical protein DFR41_106195 [Pseudacidovorax intermedius]
MSGQPAAPKGTRSAAAAAADGPLESPPTGPAPPAPGIGVQAPVGGIETGALLGIVEQAGAGIATLIEGLSREELLRSRLTRQEVLRLLARMAAALGTLAPGVRARMPELDWEGWQSLAQRLALPPGPALDDTLAFGCEAVLPATLLWLRVYRQGQPELFQMVP